jgi:hypothetical protein
VRNNALLRLKHIGVETIAILVNIYIFFKSEFIWSPNLNSAAFDLIFRSSSKIKSWEVPRNLNVSIIEISSCNLLSLSGTYSANLSELRTTELRTTYPSTYLSGHHSRGGHEVLTGIDYLITIQNCKVSKKTPA